MIATTGYSYLVLNDKWTIKYDYNKELTTRIVKTLSGFLSIEIYSKKTNHDWILFVDGLEDQIRIGISVSGPLQAMFSQ